MKHSRKSQAAGQAGESSGWRDRPVPVNGRNVVGIDVGKKRHAAAGLTASGEKAGPEISFTNDRKGIDRLEAKLLRPLGGPGRVLVAMEATGHYWMPLHFELARRGYEAVVLNPIQTRAKFRTRIRKTKTDRLDAVSIGRLVLSGEARAARIPAEKTLELRLLTRHRWRLVDTGCDLTRFALTLVDRAFPEYPNLLSKPFGATGRALIREVGLAPRDVAARASDLGGLVRSASRGRIGSEGVSALVEGARASIGIGMAEEVMTGQLRGTLGLIEAIEREANALDEELARRIEALASPLISLGLGAPVVATIHAETDPITDFRRPWQYAAFAGLDPSAFQTGQFLGTRTPVSKRGSPHLRRALYLAAMSTYRRHADLKRAYERARRKGRHHTDALVIVAHKLARIVWRLLTDNRPFRARPPRRAKGA
jgi:transposase